MSVAIDNDPGALDNARANIERNGAAPSIDIIQDDLAGLRIQRADIVLANLTGAVLVRYAEELRVKETDRISVMAGELAKMGAKITETPDGFIIDGPQQLKAATVEGHDDHRVSMSLSVAGLVAESGQGSKRAPSK